MVAPLHNLTDLRREADIFVKGLAPLANTATLVTLSGELGAGKTAFVKEVAQILDIEELVTSPTFVLENIYLLPEGAPFKRLIHIDAYRLKDGSELKHLGFAELMQDPQNLILLEWPERVSDTLATPHTQITLQVMDDKSRTISYESS